MQRSRGGIILVAFQLNPLRELFTKDHRNQWKRNQPTVRIQGKKPPKLFGRGPHQPPREEVEIKIRIADRAALLRRLARLKGRLEGTRVHEMNTLYDTPDGALARRGQLLRVRVERAAGRAGKAAKTGRQSEARPSVRLTYKGPSRPDGGSKGVPEGRSYKVREEREVRVGDANAIAGILEAVGLGPWFRYEKYRSTYRLPRLAGLKLELDETPIGDFLEIEGCREAIDRSAALLGFGPADYITRSYGSLFLEYCRASRAADPQGEPSPASGLADMLFSPSG